MVVQLSSADCLICRSPPTDPFVTRCSHVFCYECISTHLAEARNCPLCAAYLTIEMLSPASQTPPRTPESRTAAPLSSPPPLNRRPRPKAREDSAIRRVMAQAVAEAAVRTPPTAPSTCDPISEDALLTVGENLSSGQLAGIIARLQQKLEQKEDKERGLENDLLLDFLQNFKKGKQTALEKLQTEVALLDDDIRSTELEKHHSSAPETSSTTSCASGAGKQNSQTYSTAVVVSPAPEDERFVKKRKRLSRNYDVLQNHYFSTVTSQQADKRYKALQSFKEDLSKLTQYTRLRDVATLTHVARTHEGPCKDVFKASNIVSSIEFDRDSEFLATAGVTKRIKIYEFANIVRNPNDVHCPIREIKTTAKLSWICWNPYIRHHLVSSDYEGVVALWDISQGRALREYEEHEYRVWSVDYCPPKHTIFASGSDDCSVKLWSTTQRSSVLTIDKSPANVCSVRFHPSLPEKLAFGSVDNCVSYYDLRNTRQPLHVFKSHTRAVSYVKFMSNKYLVSASVDSTIKLWNLDTMTLERTFNGHANEKNFVGLSVTSDYIACGSEENSVYCYYKAIPRAFTGYRFSSQDPLTGQETQGDDDSQFVSSVCWCPRDPTKLVAANSLGTIKVLSLESEEEEEEEGE